MQCLQLGRGAVRVAAASSTGASARRAAAAAPPLRRLRRCAPTVCAAAGPPGQPGPGGSWEDRQKLEQMAARLIAAKQQQGNKPAAASGRAAPGASASSGAGPAQPRGPGVLGLLGRLLLGALLLPFRLVAVVWRGVVGALGVVESAIALVLRLALYLTAATLQGASLCCGAYSLFVLAYEFYTANPLDLVSQLTRGLNHAALWAQAQAATQPTLVRLGGSLVWAPVLPGRFLSLTSWTLILAGGYLATGFLAGFLGRLAGAEITFGPAAEAGHSLASGLAALFGGRSRGGGYGQRSYR